MEVKKLLLDSKKDCEQWDSFVSSFEHGHHHSTPFIEGAIHTFKHTNESLYCVLGDKIVAVLPLVHIKSPIFGDSLTSLPFYNYGGILSNNNLATALLIEKSKHLASTLKVKSFQLRQSSELPELITQGAQLETHKVNMHLQFPDDISMIGAGNGKKRAKLRSQATLAVRKSEELGLGLEHRFGHLELVDDFYYVFSRHMKFLGTPVYDKKFFIDLLKTMKAEAQIIVSYVNDTPSSCGFMFMHKDMMSIPWASCLVEHNHLSLNANMYYNILLRAYNLGFKKFDFGRSTLDANTYKFKMQWGAEPQQCYWYTFSDEKIESASAPQNGKFGLAVKIWKKLPLPVANFIGPYIVKQIA